MVARLIERDYYAHLVSKAGSMISSKSHHVLTDRAAFTTQSRSSSEKNIADDIIVRLGIVRENSSCLRSFSVNYGSVVTRRSI